MNKFFLILFAVFISGCTYVEPGYVGIKVNSYGSQKGVDDYPLCTGRVWYNPSTTAVYEYPTFMQNSTWTGAEKISFNTSEGSRINCDVALSYTLEPNMVPHIFVKHRQTLENITHNYLRNKVRDAINKHSAEYQAIDALGGKTQELIINAREELSSEMIKEGFVIDTLSFISAPEPEDTRVKESISLVISSTQQAIQAENKVKQFEAEARQAVAKAQGTSESILVEAKAQAEANKILSESLTPELVRYKMVEKWSGITPQVLGGDAAMMFQMGTK